MAKKVLTVAPGVALEKVAQLMMNQKIGGLPLIERGKAAGVTLNADILRALLDVTSASGTDSARIGLVYMMLKLTHQLQEL
jgi:CBS domain-containing protein